MILVLASLVLGTCISHSSKLDKFGRSCQYYQLRSDDCGTGDNGEFVAERDCCVCKLTPSPPGLIASTAPSTPSPPTTTATAGPTPSPPSSGFEYVTAVIIGCIAAILLCCVTLLCLYNRRRSPKKQRPAFTVEPSSVATETFSPLVPREPQFQPQQPRPATPPTGVALLQPVTRGADVSDVSKNIESPRQSDESSNYLPLLNVPIDEKGRGSRKRLHRNSSFSPSDRGFIAHSPVSLPALPPSDTVVSNPIEPLEPRSTTPASLSSTNYSPASTKRSMHLAKPSSVYTPRLSPRQEDIPPFRSRSPVKI